MKYAIIAFVFASSCLIPDDELRERGPSPALRSPAGLSVIELIVGLAIVSVLALILIPAVAGVGCGVGDGVKVDATQQAQQYAIGMGYQDPHVQCVSWDTDGDGYVSCTVSFTQPNGTIGKDAIECAAGFNPAGAINEGCRTPKIRSALPQ